MPSLPRNVLVAAAFVVAANVPNSPLSWSASEALAKKAPGYAMDAFVNAPPIASGQLRRFLVNPHGEIDMLVLGDGTLVKFPPHMSAALLAAVKPGDSVSVRGFREPGNVVKAFVIVNEATKQQVIEQPRFTPKLPKHLRFATLSRMQVTGTVERALRGKKGEIKGVVLDDGTVVRFPPHAAFGFAAVLQPGQPIAAEGLGTENPHGKGIEATRMGQSPTTLREIYGQ